MSTINVEKLSHSGKRSLRSGRRLAQARKEAGFSQEQIANFLGKKDRTSISNWETGKANPSLDELAKLCLKYDKSPSWLMAIDVMNKEGLDLNHPVVFSVNEELNDIEYEVNEFVNNTLPQGANREVLRSYVQLIESFLIALKRKITD